MTANEFTALCAAHLSTCADYLAAGQPDAQSAEWLATRVTKQAVENAASAIGLRIDFRTHVGRFLYEARFAPYTASTTVYLTKAVRAFTVKSK